MRRPLEAHYSFTIPSIHDDLTLDARIYHPRSFTEDELAEDAEPSPWKKKGLVMAHPYAPMSGSYDDRVVGIVVDEFAKAGWIVGTFNFRGAHGSKGRTSWSGRPELADYMSFAALFIHYMHFIQLEQSNSSANTMHKSPLDLPCTVILGGYSYGSLILKSLPPIPTILQPFQVPVTGSTADEIINRAHSLAQESNNEWRQIAEDRERTRKAQRAKPSLTMGGDETNPDQRRSSRDIRRSVDGRLSTELGQRLKSIGHRGRHKHEDHLTPLPETKPHAPITFPEVRYLLISPLAGPIATLATPALAGKFWGRKEDTEESIGKYPTLAVYGDQDIFTSAKKTRDWSQRLSELHGIKFSSVEVAQAGHFWVEQGAEKELRSSLRDWQGTIV